MLYSKLTRKGQTTIPKEVRKFLGLHAEDKIVYSLDPENKSVSLTPVKGTILGLKGVVRGQKSPLDFKRLRSRTKNFVLSKKV